VYSLWAPSKQQVKTHHWKNSTNYTTSESRCCFFLHQNRFLHSIRKATTTKRTFKVLECSKSSSRGGIPSPGLSPSSSKNHGHQGYIHPNMKNYIHVKIFFMWTLIISTLANEWAKTLCPSPNPAVMHSLFVMGRANKYNPTVVPCLWLVNP